MHELKSKFLYFYDKMINCGDPAFGGAMYACSKCGNLKFVPFRCKSRFCPTCGVKYCQDRSNAVRSVVLRMFFQMNKSKNFVPGFICVLHTFGRPLEWNPHIHCLITEGGFSDDGFWRVVKHFNYTLLRKSFQTALLNEMEKHIGPSFKKTKALIYKKDSNGFYARHHDNDKQLRKAIHPSKHKFIPSYSKWRNNIAASFGYDPLCCSKCKATMTLTDLYFKHKRVSLEEMYERSMAKIKCHSA